MSDLEKQQCTDRDIREREQQDDLRTRVEALEREIEKLKGNKRDCIEDHSPVPLRGTTIRTQPAAARHS